MLKRRTVPMPSFEELREQYLIGDISRTAALDILQIGMQFQPVIAKATVRLWDAEVARSEVIVAFPEPDDNSTVFDSNEYWEKEGDNKPLMAGFPPPHIWVMFLLFVGALLYYVSTLQQ